MVDKQYLLSCPGVSNDRAGRIVEMKKNISQWVLSPALNRLVEAFGGDIPADAGLESVCRYLEDFSENWDFRGKQRQAVDSTGEAARWLVDGSGLTENQKAETMKTAQALGLCGTSELTGKEFQHIWVLGGARLSCLLRSRLALKLVNDLVCTPKSLAMLAAMRPVGASEREATDTYAPHAETEFDLFAAAAKSVFGLDGGFTEERYDDKNNANNSWVIRRYDNTGYDFHIIAAPSSDPLTRRANSADSFVYYMDHFRVPEGASILLASSQIYVPYQNMEAIRTVALKYNVYVETVGFPLEWNGALQGMNNPQNYLQEIRSALQAINRFLTANLENL